MLDGYMPMSKDRYALVIQHPRIEPGPMFLDMSITLSSTPISAHLLK